MKAPTNSTRPRMVNTMPASTFAARFLSTSGVMSLSSQVTAGAGVEVRRSVRSRIVAHAARHVLYFRRPHETPPSPLGEAKCRDEENAVEHVSRVLSHQF